MRLEIIGFNIESCLTAQRAGADRIELCANPAEGGTTPSGSFIKAARKVLDIELYVMIRHRGGNFVYSPQEFEIMKEDILFCRQAGCDGVVLGLLDRDGKIDIRATGRLVEYAYPLGVTFHRAFDRVRDPLQSLEDVINSGCERILTSGLKPKAPEGIAVIRELIEKAGDRIIIMPGSGITASNIEMICKETAANEFHSSASISKHENIMTNEAFANEESYLVADEDRIRNMREILDKLGDSIRSKSS